jgi:hypothetical protein
MKIYSNDWYVVTPVSSEPLEWIVKCAESVNMQMDALANVGFLGRVVHVIIYDGRVSHKLDRLRFDLVELTLSRSSSDFGDTPRAIGSAYAISRKAFAVSYLDGDNWWSQDHLAQVFRTYLSTKSCVITTNRELMHINGDSLGVVCLTSDGNEFTDTNCLNLISDGRHFSSEWQQIHENEHAIADRVIWQLIKESKITRTHINKSTVYYRVKTEGVYRDLGEEAVVGNRPNDCKIKEALDHYSKRTGKDCVLNWKYAVNLQDQVRVSKLLRKYKLENNSTEYIKLKKAYQEFQHQSGVC